MQIAKIILVVAVTALCACSHDNHDDNSGGGVVGPFGGGNEQMKDVTNRSSCSGTSPTNISLYNTWHMQMASAHFNMDMAFTIGPNSITLTNTCFAQDGTTLDVSVSVPLTVTGNQLSFPAGQNSTHIERGPNKYNCSVSLNASSVTYDFAGTCLALHNNGQTGYLVP
jgi:hypothetical protein